MAQTKFTRKAVTVSAVALIAWAVFINLLMISEVVTAERPLKDEKPKNFVEQDIKQGVFVRMMKFLWQTGGSSYQPVWPVSLIFNLVLHRL